MIAIIGEVRKTQFICEYALLIAIIVGALLAMQNYLKRSSQGQLQRAGDQLGDQYSYGLTTASEHSESSQDITTVEFGAFVRPITTISTSGSFSRNARRRIGSLREELED